MRISECPRCSVTMEMGFIPEQSDKGLHRPQWVEGEVMVGLFSYFRLRKRRRIPFVTYRCPRCGLLESYAREASS